MAFFKNSFSKIKLIAKAYLNKVDNDKFKVYLERMALVNPQTSEEKITQKLLSYALKETEFNV